MSQTGTVGIVGGGQLGMMLTETALKLGFKVVVLDPTTPECPAKQVGAEQIVGNFYDKAALRSLLDRCDYLTFETEHFDASQLPTDSQHPSINPAPSTVAMIQDKYAQKLFLSALAPIATFRQLQDEASAAAVFEEWGGSMIIKTRRGGFDGRGNLVVKSQEDITKAFQTFADQELYAEQLVDFRKELSVMVARDIHGNVASYPLTEMLHERSICIETLTPADVSPEIAKQATDFARNVVQHLDGAGVFGIEMFLTNDDKLLINEIAPRVHNSGHYTIEACQTSQFEQHIRAITGMELGPTDMTVPAAVMINILGERNGPTDPQGVDKAEALPHTYVHLYGKSPTKIDRKMGHITVTGETVAEAGKVARQARAAITI